MKSGIHPDLHPCIFIDSGSAAEFVTRSTMTSKNKRTVDGVEYNLIQIDISSASHPFYTGKQRAITTDGRVERFNKKYGITTTPAAS